MFDSRIGIEAVEKLIVDFVIPEVGGGPAGHEPAAASRAPAPHSPGPCSCGANDFMLASEMKSDTRGIPASRMFECVACGAYRLG